MSQLTTAQAVKASVSESVRCVFLWVKACQGIFSTRLPAEPLKCNITLKREEREARLSACDFVGKPKEMQQYNNYVALPISRRRI